MTKITAKICIQLDEVDAVKLLLEKHLSLKDITNNDQFNYGFNITLLDCSSEIEYTIAFMKENNIIEKSPLDHYYDYEQSKIVLFVVASPFSLFIDCLPSLVEGIAGFISRKIKTRCAVFIEDLPMCAYENGEKTIEILESYRKYKKSYFV